MQIEAIVLGSGQDGGAPQVGSKDHRGAVRNASSIAIRTASGRVGLFDASPDLRQQWIRLNDLAWVPDGIGSLASVAITHAHMGHYAGLVHLGKEASNAHGVPLLALPSVHAYLKANEPWSTLYAQQHVVAHDATDPFEIDDHIVIRAVEVPHRAEFARTAAFSIEIDDTPWLLYLPDIDGWDEWQGARTAIARHRIALVDATFSEPDEVPGRSIAEVKHPFVADTVERFRDLTDDTRIILTHINHSNSVSDPLSASAARAVAAGFEVAFDGLRLGFER